MLPDYFCAIFLFSSHSRSLRIPTVIFLAKGDVLSSRPLDRLLLSVILVGLCRSAATGGLLLMLMFVVRIIQLHLSIIIFSLFVWLLVRVSVFLLATNQYQQRLTYLVCFSLAYLVLGQMLSNASYCSKYQEERWHPLSPGIFWTFFARAKEFKESSK